MNGATNTPRDTRLQGRIAIITGASSGLGRATSIKYASAGAKVVLADLKSSGVEDELNKLHGADTAIFVPCDVTNESQIQSLIQSAVDFGGRLDIICNYAGVALEASKYNMDVRMHTMETKDWDFEMGVNARGVWLCCKYAVIQMLKQEPREANRRGERTRGWVVNAASMLGTIATPGAAAYVPSKFAVVGMTKQMALDYAKDRIHVNALAPGYIKTPMIAPIISKAEEREQLVAAHPWNALGHAEDIADAALFLASDEASWVTGHTMVVDGGFTAQ